MAEFDPRIVRVGIEVDGQLKVYESLASGTGYAIKAVGTKYANANQNEAEVTIYNVDNDTLNYILTETTPFNNNRTPKRIFVDAGRQSYGTVRVYSGNIIASNPTQPPDIGLTLKCLTGNYKKGDVISKNRAYYARLSQISQDVASDLEAALDFQATDKNITNYSYSGGALQQIDELNQFGKIDVYLDNDTLVVKDQNVPLTGKIIVLSLDTGMIGIPESTEQGIRVRFLLDGQTTLGGQLQVTSQIYPALNGNYAIYKLGFDISSRDIPFYWIAEGLRL